MTIMTPIRRAGAALLMTLLASCGSSERSANEINFSILSTESSENLLPKWQPFLDDMVKQTGLTIKPYEYRRLHGANRLDRRPHQRPKR
jgi:ABC-type phosphate/phosphonate transport system substrate-binding protein